MVCSWHVRLGCILIRVLLATHAALKLPRPLCVGRITSRTSALRRIACIPIRWAAVPSGGRVVFRHILLGNRRLTSSAGSWVWTPSPFDVLMAYRKAVSQALACACVGLACARRWIVRLIRCIGTSPSPVVPVKRLGVVWLAASGAWGAGVVRVPG